MGSSPRGPRPRPTSTAGSRARPAVLAALALTAGLAWSEPAGAGDLRPGLLRRATYGESFTFIADLDDGGYVQLTLSVTNLGPGGTKGLCRGLVVPAQGAPWRASDRFARDAIAYDEGPPERLAVGPCRVTVRDDATGVEVPLEDGHVHLELAARPARRAGREATVAVGEDRYRTEVLLYRVPARAEIALPGRPRQTAPGAGYADHSRGTIAPRELAARWVRFRALRGPTALLVLGREGHDGRFGPLWACRGEERCGGGDAFRVERSAGARAPAFRVEVDGAGAPLELRSGALLYRDAPVEDLGVLGKLVAPFTGSPVTYVFRGRARDGDGPEVDGILEVELAGE